MYTLIVGTRPELVKTRPVVLACRARGIPLRILCTDQHTTLLEEFAHDPVWADMVHLHLPHDSDPIEYVRQTTERLVGHIVQPGQVDGVLVQGDTGTALAGAQAAARCHVRVMHIEAGIRSHDLSQPWPEEGFRREITRLAFAHFAATEENRLNLLAEGIDSAHIFLTGNPGLDHLKDYPKPKLPFNRCLVTLHRRESFGQPLHDIVHELARIAERHPGVEFIWPVHPNPGIQAALAEVSTPPNVFRVPPLPSEVFTQLLASSKAVLTDSGGVQEEAAFLGIPCVVARHVTDRPESVASGHALLAGTRVAEPLHQALTFGLKASPFLGFGDGNSGDRIASHLQGFLAGVPVDPVQDGIH